ncbi:hypothetical protein BJY00DRAFT_58389 [Aspergillus carlsbadensis]|nr:hypothetical protein BJY00DRAFT_58389 [Aspergillus carlsbadensis]
MIFGADIAGYDLQLDRSTIFPPADRNNESSPCVTGRFHLALTRATSIKGIRARVVGTMKTPRYGMFTPAIHEETTFERSQNLVFSKTLDSFTMPAGNYEFPIEISLKGALLETLTGPGHEYHTYRVEVVVERRMQWDLAVSEPLRIYQWRPGGISVLPEKTIEESSNQDIQYHISIPDPFVRHGSVFPVECWIEPLSEDTTVASITIRLHEKHDLCFNATAAESMKYDTNFITWHHDYVILKEKCDLSPRTVAQCEERLGMQQVTVPVRLPERPDACSQSFSSRTIKIEHLLVVEIEYQDREIEGTKKATQTLPMYIYMAPPSHNEGNQPPPTREIQCFKTDHNCPPSYGQHELDQMLSGLMETGDGIC